MRASPTRRMGSYERFQDAVRAFLLLKNGLCMFADDEDEDEDDAQPPLL